MTDTIVRQIHGDEMAGVMHWLTAYAFHSSPPMPDEAERQEMFKQRPSVYYALFEDDQPRASAVYAQMTQQVRGKIFPMAGVWGVATHPAARRKGYARRVLTRLLAAMHEDGRPLSCLYPFRESFYERLGYVALPQCRRARFAPSVLQPLVKKDLGGEVELMSIGDGYDLYRNYVYRLQQRVHGMSVFDYGDKAGAQRRNNSWVALARAGGELVGLMLYDLKGDEITEFNLRATRFYYDTSQGKYLLLQWIAQHIDQANRAEIWLAPFELPETWLSDMKVSTEPLPHPPMGRVVDVAQIGGMQAGIGRFSARLADPICPWNEGIWQFEAAEGTLVVELIAPASSVKKADCELSIQGLTALLYGVNDPGDFAIRSWGNPSPDVQAIMRGMFVPRLPYMHEVF